MIQSGRFLVPFLSIYLVLLGGWPSASAQTASVFTVKDIRVDATAENAVAAKEQAHIDGQRKGLARLLRRLVPASDHDRLPDANRLPVERYVQNFEIADERLSNTRYLARMTVTFDPEGVRSLLQAERLPFSDQPSAPLVVLPLYEDPRAPALWPENNPWWAAWAETLDGGRLLRLIMPLGDLEDMGVVTIEQARNGDAAALQRLANRYGAEDVIVVSATPLADGTAGRPVSVRLAAMRAGAVEQSGQPFDLEGAPGQPLADVLRGAVSQLQNSLDEQWKRANLLRLDTGGLMFVDIPIASLADWVEINRNLETLPEVSQVEIATFAQKLVQVQIYYVGDEVGFERALGGLGLTLSREGDSWLLRPTVANPGLSEPQSGTPRSS